MERVAGDRMERISSTIELRRRSMAAMMLRESNGDIDLTSFYVSLSLANEEDKESQHVQCHA